MEKYKNEIRDEINKRWENELKKKINDMMEPKINKIYENIIINLNSIINSTIEKLEYDLMPEKNRLPANLVPIKESNKLINPILICLSNIDAFMNLGFIRDKKNIMKSLNEKVNNNLFSSISNLMFKLWTTKEIQCDPKEVDNKLKALMNQEDYKGDDPGVIISFILNKLNEEIYMNQDILKDKNTKGIIENNFFLSVILTYSCDIFGKDSEPNKIKQKEKVLDLYLNEPDKITGFGRFNKNTFEDHFFFMLIKDFDVKKHCEICQRSHMLRAGKIIDNLGNYLIINLNREKDKNRYMNFIYPKEFKFSDISKEKVKENSSYELVSVIMDNKINEDDEMENDENIKIMTYSKNFNDNRWYLYTDKNIKTISNENEIFSSKNALILVYRKKKDLI